MRNVPYFLFITLFAVGLSPLSAQDIPTGEIEDAQIIIEKDKPLTLPKAGRNYQKTEVLPISSDTVTLRFNLSQPSFKFSPFIYQLQTKPYQVGAEATRNHNYVKAGFGNYLSPLLEGYVGQPIAQGRVGAWVNHESFARGPVNDEKSAYGRSDILLNAVLEGGSIVFEPTFFYEREAYYYYGYKEPIFLSPGALGPITEKVSANHFTLSSVMRSTKESELQWAVKPGVSFTNMAAGGNEAFNKESHFDLQGSVDYEMSATIQSGALVGYNYLAYQSGTFSQKRNVLDITPFVRFHQEKVELKAGVKLAVGSDTVNSTGVFVYPDVYAKYQLNDQLGVYAELSGGLNPQTLNNTRLTNRYLEDSLTLLNQNQKIALNAGLQFLFVENLMLQPFIGYSLTQNKMLMAPSEDDSSRFLLTYDQGNFGQVDLGVKVKYITNRTTVTAEMILSGYQPDQALEAWYLPATQVNLKVDQQVGEVIRLHAGVIILDGIKGQETSASGVNLLPAIVDISMGGTYAFSEAFSGFIDFKNLLGVEYERYLNYPSRGLTGKLGFIYRF